MTKIDKRRHYYLFIDTETAGDIKHPLPYDLGVQVRDTAGNVYKELSLVIYDVYVGEKELMKSAYYASKLSEYEAGLHKGEWKMVKALTAFRIVRNLMEEYGITEVAAYNTRFDVRALNNLVRVYTKYRFFFPAGTVFWDAWNMACSTIFQQKSFYKMAESNGWQSDKGNVRTNAEVGYAYVSGNHEFKERHTALDDVRIEAEILMRCLKAKVKAEDKLVVGNPWRKPQPKWREYLAKAGA